MEVTCPSSLTTVSIVKARYSTGNSPPRYWDMRPQRERYNTMAKILGNNPLLREEKKEEPVLSEKDVAAIKAAVSDVDEL